MVAGRLMLGCRVELDRRCAEGVVLTRAGGRLFERSVVVVDVQTECTYP
jgi:hypothetical protein